MKTIYRKFICRGRGRSLLCLVHVPKTVFSAEYRVLLELLARKRTQARVSQEELARRLGRPQPFISYVERGERRVDVIEFYAILKALGADPEDAFHELAQQLPDGIKI